MPDWLSLANCRRPGTAFVRERMSRSSALMPSMHWSGRRMSSAGLLVPARLPDDRQGEGKRVLPLRGIGSFEGVVHRPLPVGCRDSIRLVSPEAEIQPFVRVIDVPVEDEGI